MLWESGTEKISGLDRVNNIDIVSDRHDEEDDNFAEGLNLCFLRDGSVAMEADLKMNNFHIKGLAQGSASNDAVTYGQVQTMIDNIGDVAHLSASQTFTGNNTFSGNTTTQNLTVSGDLNIPGGKIWIA